MNSEKTTNFVRMSFIQKSFQQFSFDYSNFAWDFELKFQKLSPEYYRREVRKDLSSLKHAQAFLTTIPKYFIHAFLGDPLYVHKQLPVFRSAAQTTL